MKSFLSVEHISGKVIRCEVENVPIDTRPDDAIIWDCFMADVDRKLFRSGSPVQGSIYSCIHENGKVLEICDLETMEKERRIRLLMDLI